VTGDIVQSPELRARPGISDALIALATAILQPADLLSDG